MIVLDALLGREMVVDQGGPDTLYLVGAHRRADPAAADREAAIHFLSYHRSGQGNDEVGIVVVVVQCVRAKIDDLVARS